MIDFHVGIEMLLEALAGLWMEFRVKGNHVVSCFIRGYGYVVEPSVPVESESMIANEIDASFEGHEKSYAIRPRHRLHSSSSWSWGHRSSCCKAEAGVRVPSFRSPLRDNFSEGS